jgi:flagellar protein FlgJ
MFYARINKIKVFNNREGFLGLFNSAEMRIYSYAAGYSVNIPPSVPPLTLTDLINLDETARLQKLQEAVETEVNKFAQSATLEINGVKDNQSLLFGDSGLLIYQSDAIPTTLDLQLWVIESDEDVRRFALDAEQVIDSNAFKSLFVLVETALTVASPVLSGTIAISSVVANLLRKKLQANKDDLVGYWQATLNRAEHYPHGSRDKQDIPDTTGNIRVDYTLFGFENKIENNSPSSQDIPRSTFSSQPSAPDSQASTPSDFVRQIYPAAQRLYETRDGLHPLFVTAQAALETGWKIKTAGNNIFGVTKGASWTGPVNLLLTTEIFGTPDKQFVPPEKVVSVEPVGQDRYRYTVYRLFRAYDTPEDSLEDHLALLKGPLYRDAWPCRHDPREYARRIAPTYASSPDYAKTLIAIIDRVEKIIGLQKQ